MRLRVLEDHGAEIEVALMCPHLSSIAQRDHTSLLNRQVSQRAFSSLVTPKMAEILKLTVFRGKSPVDYIELFEDASDQDIMELCNVLIRLNLLMIYFDEDAPNEIFGRLSQMLHMRNVMIAATDE